MTQPSSALEIVTPMSRWIAEMAQRVATGELAKNTFNAYKIGPERFVLWQYNETESNNDWSAKAIRSWMAALVSQGASPSTVNLHLSGLRNFCAWLVENKVFASNPCDSVKSVSRRGAKTKHKRSALTDLEVERVLAVYSPALIVGNLAAIRNRAILHLMAYTGIRSVEAHRADLMHIKTEAGKTVLRVHGKGHHEADDFVVLSHPDAEGALMDWVAARGQAPGPLFTSCSDRSLGGRLSLRSIRQIVKESFKIAGVVGDDKTTHSLRHSAISNAIRHGATPQKAQSMARHSNINTTMIYYHELDRIENPAEEFINYGH